MSACNRPVCLLVVALAALLVATSAQTALSQEAPVAGPLCACTTPSSQACQDAVKARCDKPEDPALKDACTQMTSFALNGAAKPAQGLTKYLQQNCNLQPPAKASACACVAGADTPDCVNAGWFACINGNSLCPGMMLGQKAAPEAVTRLANYIGDKCPDLGVNNVEMNFTDISADNFTQNVAPGVLQSLANITGVPPYMITTSLTSLGADGKPLTPAAANASSGEEVPATGLPGGAQLAPGAGAAAAGATAGPGAAAAADPNASAADKGIAATQAMGFGHRKLLQGGGIQQAIQRQVAKQVGKQVVKYAIRSLKNKQGSVNESLSAAAADNGAGFQKAFSYYGVKANPSISVNGAPAVGGPPAGTPAVAGAAQAAQATSRIQTQAPAVAAEAAKADGSKPMSSGAVAGLIIGCFFAALLLGLIPLLVCMGCWRKSIEASPAAAKLATGKPHASGHSSSGMVAPTSAASGTKAAAAGAGVAAVGAAAAAKAAHGMSGSASDKDVRGIRDTGDQSGLRTSQAAGHHTNTAAVSGMTAVEQSNLDGKTQATLTGAGASGAAVAASSAPTSSARSARHSTHDDVYVTAHDNVSAGDAGTAAAGMGATAGASGTRGARAIAEGTSSSNEEAAVKELEPDLGRSDSRPSLFSRMMGLD